MYYSRGPIFSSVICMNAAHAVLDTMIIMYACMPLDLVFVNKVLCFETSYYCASLATFYHNLIHQHICLNIYHLF